MKAHLIVGGVLATGLLLLAAQPSAAGQITGSKHDFRTSAWGGGQNGQICIACHAPHKTDTSVTDAPLWNHKNSTATYTLYSSATMDAGPLGAPGGLSKLCLSCHDGTVALDSFGGATGTTMITGAAYSPKSNLGTTLNDDHPIGFTYDSTLATRDGALADPATPGVVIGSGTQTRTGTLGAMLLYNGKLECSSCHDVHNTFTDDNGAKLMKISMAGSKLCLTCHKK
jgi:predicted CXXCH cytochrome family protein